jgi:hypothetical protein
MRQSGVSDSAAVRLANEALGPEEKKKKKKQKQDLRAAIIARLKDIGEKARKVVTGK